MIYRPKKPFTIKLDEDLVIDRKWYLIDINEKGVVKVYNKFATDDMGGYMLVRVNHRGWFRGTPKQIEKLKTKLEEL